MTYVRLSPSDYRAVAEVAGRLDFSNHSLPTFRVVLSLSLAERFPELAERVRRLTDAEARVLRDRLCAASNGSGRPRFTPGEWRTLLDACRTFPPTARFARPLQRFLISCFRDDSPELARKVARMETVQFERLLGQLRGRWGGA